MKQKQYNSMASLLSGGTAASAGAGEHGTTLGLVFGTKVLIDADVNALIVERDGHRTARAQLSTRYKTQTAKTKIAAALVSAARDVLRRKIGPKYSLAWQGTGFNNSLKVPRSVSGLEDACRSLETYFTANPTFEVADLGVTAALAETALNDLVAARAAVNSQRTVVGAKLTVRRSKEKALRSRIAGTIEELGRIIEPLDDRWLAFGFNKPGQLVKPDAPQKLEAALGGTNQGVLKWEPSPRAEYYRVWFRKKGVEAEFAPAGTPKDPKFTIEDLPAASEIEIAVSAVNNGGESLMSEIKTIITE